MLTVVSPMAYGLGIVVGVVVGVVGCVTARGHPGRWAVGVARVAGVILAVDAAVWWLAVLPSRGGWSMTSSLPFALCNMAVFVAAAACWWQTPLLVELTWFWGLTGALQAIATPDLTVAFPHPEFFQYTAGHLAVVIAAFYLVIGLRITPRPGAVSRVFLITLVYTLVVGAIDAATGANYMFLRSPPSTWTLLRLLGPWPWYVATAAALALGLLALLNLPFWLARRAKPSAPRPRGPETDELRSPSHLNPERGPNMTRPT